MPAKLRHQHLTWGETSAIPAVAKGRVLALGNFDGLHLGHQKLVHMAEDLATKLSPGRLAAILTFAPHPRKIVRPDAPLKYLTTPAHFQKLLGELGIEDLISLKFDDALAHKTGEEFLRWLKDHLAPVALCVGFNFSFGHGKSAGITELREWGESLGVQVFVMPEMTVADVVVSSSHIRKMIASAASAEQLAQGSELLGRSYSVVGEVIPGARRGRGLGFPTANLDVTDLVLPTEGVYATSVRLLAVPDDQEILAVSHLGVTDTFGETKPKLETHLLDFDRDLYGQLVEVIFHEKLRDNQKFSEIAHLKAAIQKDVLARRNYLPVERASSRDPDRTLQ